jgi:hypothetical protein
MGVPVAAVGINQEMQEYWRLKFSVDNPAIQKKVLE